MGITTWVPRVQLHTGPPKEPQRPTRNHPLEKREPGTLTSEAPWPRGLTLLLLGALTPLIPRLQVPVEEQIRGQLSGRCFKQEDVGAATVVSPLST